MKLLPILICFIIATSCDGMDRSFRVTFRVVNDEGRPVVGAKVGVSWENAEATKPSERIKTAEDITDQDGRVTLEGKTFVSGISYGANKKGHYAAWGLRYYFKDTRLLRWQPWDPTVEVVLKRIKNPVPMYAKRVHGAVPAKDVDVGYDFAVGDWVAPYGKGKISDMIFHGEGEVKDNRNYRGKLTVVFPGQGNGLIPFENAESNPNPLRMPYEAPSEGYEVQRIWRSIRHYNPKTMENEEYVNDSSKTQNFFIRVRSELDAEGKVVRAWYGKIHAPFEFGPSFTTGLPSISFVFYANPDGTRNIEYDPKRNLLKSSKPHDPDYENLAP